MAKKEQTRSYMQAYIPQGGKKKYTSEMAYFNGLDLRKVPDSRGLVECVNIDVTSFPEVVSVGVAKSAIGKDSDGNPNAINENIFGIFGYEKSLYVLCEKDNTVSLAKITDGTIKATVTWESTNVGEKREMGVFCVYSPKENEMYYDATPEYDLLIYPDRKYISIREFSTVKNITDTSPVFEHFTIWNGRVFGSKGNLVVCSSASTFKDYSLDTPESTDEDGLTTGGYDASHAWYTTTQANTQSSGNITAITAYDGHPIVFKDDYMHQINNNKNPFRLQDIVAIGCVSARSVCELDSVLYFASSDGIYRYSGGYPKRISEALGEVAYDESVVCGAYDGVLYMYNKHLDPKLVYTYCPANGAWSSIDNPHGTNYILSFAVNDEGIYSVGANGKIFVYPESKVDGGSSDWYFKTAPILNGSSEDKRVHSISVTAEGDDIEATLSGDSIGGIWSRIIGKQSLDGVDKMRALIRQTDSLFHSLYFEGKGKIRIYRVDLTYSYSGKRYI